MTSDDQQNLPATICTCGQAAPMPYDPECPAHFPAQKEVVHATQIPVAEFEGEYVRLMLGKLPGITLPMDFGYARGTHLKLELEVRVRKVSVDELNSNNRDLGAMKGDLFRLHEFTLEEAKIVGAFTAEQADPGVGGGLAATGHDVEDEETDDHLEGEADAGQDDDF